MHVDGQRTQKTWLSENAIILGLKNPMVYQKCLKENQDMLTAERVIKIATDRLQQRLSNHADSQYGIGSSHSHTGRVTTQVHKLQGKHQEDGKSANGQYKSYKYDTSKGKDQEGMKRQNCYCCGAW